MEYVFVSFKEDRSVRADGEILGQTNQTLLIVRGHHSFTLEGPADFQPPMVDAVIQRTTSIHPYIIEFK
jgi:hypothetical protein